MLFADLLSQHLVTFLMFLFLFMSLSIQYNFAYMHGYSNSKLLTCVYLHYYYTTRQHNYK